MSDKVIFLAWNQYTNRNVVLSSLLGIDAFHIGKSRKTKMSSLFSYIGKFFATINVFRKQKPDIVIVTNSAFVLPLACFILKPFFGFRIILDSHSSGIYNSFLAYPKFLMILFSRRALLNIVTNDVHASLVNARGGQTLVLPDPPMDVDPIKEQIARSPKSICFINTYSSDEPYLEVINCAGQTPDIHFYITGNPGNRKLPEYQNLTYTGFLPRADYLALLQRVDMILVLTTRENTFQCGGNEAMSFRKPLIISKTEYLMHYFEDACVYVEPDQQSISDGIRKLSSDYENYVHRISLLYEHKTADSRQKIAELKQILNLPQ
jgi:glycosyltransferase involved in cell wall biosynthesis